MSAYNYNRNVDHSIFRTYDIRGVVDETLTPDVVYTIGLAIGSDAQDRGQNKIAIGRDGRLSGPDYLAALSQGLRDSGCDVINIGEVSTPVLYYAATGKVFSGVCSGVMITGSHNPPDFNGIKTVLDGTTLCEDAITNLYDRIKTNDMHHGEGKEECVDIIDLYIDDVVNKVKLARPMKIVIDCGNGVGGKIAPKLFKKLGCETTELFCDVDGTFPNHHPDPQDKKNLTDIIRAVKEQGAEVGLAFDGDADRLGVVTNKGEVIWPDRQMMLFVRDIVPRHPGSTIPFDVKCTRHLPNEIKKAGGIPEMIRTGHALLKAKVWELDAPIGGELSGHFFFKENWYGFDDGIYSGVRLLQILSKTQKSSSQVFNEIPDSINTPELKMHMDDNLKYDFMEKFISQAEKSFSDGNINTIDGLRVDFKDGFGLMRPSNTTPCIIFRFEGDSAESLDKIKNKFKQQLLALDNELELPF
ncbi:MAG: phosphomannomutase/phosphoglucomutase [Gammaproteobacteria bacterium]|nr:phosphomannomutase/phosphoglucomutase [Gammaproteobacteria bacterium]